LAEAVASAAGQKGLVDSYRTLQQETSQLLGKGETVPAAKKIEQHVEQNRHDSERALRWVLQLTCRLVNEQKASQALEFVAALENPVWRETGFQLGAALAARKGLAGTAWEFAADKNRRLPATEQVALLHGLVVALYRQQ
jgi:hypothetical protein